MGCTLSSKVDDMNNTSASSRLAARHGGPLAEPEGGSKGSADAQTASESSAPLKSRIALLEEELSIANKKVEYLEKEKAALAETVESLREKVAGASTSGNENLQPDSKGDEDHAAQNERLLETLHAAQQELAQCKLTLQQGKLASSALVDGATQRERDFAAAQRDSGLLRNEVGTLTRSLDEVTAEKCDLEAKVHQLEKSLKEAAWSAATAPVDTFEDADVTNVADDVVNSLARLVDMCGSATCHIPHARMLQLSTVTKRAHEATAAALAVQSSRAPQSLAKRLDDGLFESHPVVDVESLLGPKAAAEDAPASPRSPSFALADAPASPLALSPSGVSSFQAEAAAAADFETALNALDFQNLMSSTEKERYISCSCGSLSAEGAEEHSQRRHGGSHHFRQSPLDSVAILAAVGTCKRPFVAAMSLESPLYPHFTAACRSVASSAEEPAAVANFVTLWGPVFKAFSSQLQGLPKVSSVVYKSSVDRIPAKMYLPGSVTIWPAPTSATKAPAVAASGLKVDGDSRSGSLFVIESKSARSVASVSLYDKEDEVMFRAGTQFRVSQPPSSVIQEILSAAFGISLATVDLCLLSEVSLNCFDDIIGVLTDSESSVASVIQEAVDTLPEKWVVIDGRGSLRPPALWDGEALSRFMSIICAIPNMPSSVLNLFLVHDKRAEITPDQYGEWAVLAMQSGNSGGAKMLIERGNLPDTVIASIVLSAAKLNASSLEDLLSLGIDCNVKSAGGKLPIFAPLASGNVEVLRVLLRHGVDVSVRNQSNQSPLHVAAKNGHTEMVQLLLEQGCDVNARASDQSTAIYYASHSGHSEIVSALIKAGADFELGRQDGTTPLLAAACKGYIVVVHALMEAGATANVANNSGLSPIFGAVQSDKADVMSLMLDKGVPLDSVDNDGDTLFAVAAMSGSAGCFKELLDRGADVNQLGSDGMTILFRAAQAGHASICKLILEAGADVDTGKTNGTSPLSMACYAGHGEVVKLLLDHGADPNKANDKGQTPIAIATKKNRISILEMLVVHQQQRQNAASSTPLLPSQVAAAAAVAAAAGASAEDGESSESGDEESASSTGTDAEDPAEAATEVESPVESPTTQEATPTTQEATAASPPQASDWQEPSGAEQPNAPVPPLLIPMTVADVSTDGFVEKPAADEVISAPASPSRQRKDAAQELDHVVGPILVAPKVKQSSVAALEPSVDVTPVDDTPAPSQSTPPQNESAKEDGDHVEGTSTEAVAPIAPPPSEPVAVVVASAAADAPSGTGDLEESPQDEEVDASVLKALAIEIEG